MTEITLYHKDWCWAYRTDQGEMECPPYVKTRGDIDSYFGPGYEITCRGGKSGLLRNERRPRMADYGGSDQAAARSPRPLRLKRPHTGGRNAKPVHQYTLEGDYVRSFGSLSAAAQAVGSRAGVLSNSLHRQASHTAAGFRWSFELRDRLPGLVSTRPRGMVYGQYDFDGRRVAVFHSSKAAATSLGINPCGISQCFNGQQRTAGGAQWRRAWSLGELPEIIEPLDRSFGAGDKPTYR